MNRAHRLIPLALISMTVSGAIGGDSGIDDPTEGERTDCGTVALVGLLWFASRDSTLDEVAAALASPTPRGHSLAMLRDGAKRLRLDVEGIQLLDGDRSPDRPMIAFLERGGHGHFVAIRPVGHTGSLVQVIDGLAEPEVMDMRTLVRQPGWTGLGLTTRGPRWAFRSSMILGGATLLLILAAIGRRRLPGIVAADRRGPPGRA